MESPTPRAEFGPVSIYFGQKTGKYPDGNQVIVRGREATPCSTRRRSRTASAKFSPRPTS